MSLLTSVSAQAQDFRGGVTVYIPDFYSYESTLQATIERMWLDLFDRIVRSNVLINDLQATSAEAAAFEAVASIDRARLYLRHKPKCRELVGQNAETLFYQMRWNFQPDVDMSGVVASYDANQVQINLYQRFWNTYENWGTFLRVGRYGGMAMAILHELGHAGNMWDGAHVMNIFPGATAYIYDRSWPMYSNPGGPWDTPRPPRSLNVQTISALIAQYCIR